MSSKRNNSFIKRTYLVLFAVSAVMFLRFVIIPEYICQREYSEYVTLYSNKYGLEENLVYSIIKSESNFNQNAVSGKGAIGLMQIMESTGRWAASEIGIKDFEPSMLLNPETNIEIGCWYLKWLMKNFDNMETVIAAYNAGNGNVSRWLSDSEYSDDGVKISLIPYSETKTYVKKVRLFYNLYKMIY